MSLPELPCKLTVGRRNLPLRWDVPSGLLIAEMLDDELLTSGQKAGLLTDMLFRTKIRFWEREAAAEAALGFFQGGEVTILPEKKKPCAPLFSLWQDVQWILPSFLETYQLNPLAGDMHWWTFLSLLAALPSHCALGRVMALRRAEPQPHMSVQERQRLLEAKSAVSLTHTSKPDSQSQEVLAYLRRL